MLLFLLFVQFKSESEVSWALSHHEAIPGKFSPVKLGRKVHLYVASRVFCPMTGHSSRVC